jgi:hypothetical protein
MYHVFYHFPCNDGKLSQIIWNHFEPNSLFYKWIHNKNTESIEIINNLPPNSSVVFLDITPPILLLPSSHSYIIIDHHKNAMLELIRNKPNHPNYNILLYAEKGFPENNMMSGCMLTWKYMTNDIYPSVVYHIGNKDVWNFNNPDTEPYCLGYEISIETSIEISIETDKFIDNMLITNDMDGDIIKKGNELIEKYKSQATTYFTENMLKLTIETYDDITYNIIDITCPDINLYKYLIDISKDYYNDMHVLRILKEQNGNIKTYSLRSLFPNINVDNIARYYGGNGHEKAAGYTIIE